MKILMIQEIGKDREGIKAGVMGMKKMMIMVIPVVLFPEEDLEV